MKQEDQEAPLRSMEALSVEEEVEDGSESHGLS